MSKKIIEDRSGLKRGLSTLAITPLSIKYIAIPLIVFAFIMASFPYRAHAAETSVGVWWPTDGAHVTNVQPFKAMLDGMSVDKYDMYWQVDGGGLVSMPSNYKDYPHKEATVDLKGWIWKGKGPYVVTFVAKRNGVIVGQRSVNIYNDGATSLPATNGGSTGTQTQIVAISTQTTQVQTQTITTSTTSMGSTSPTSSGQAAPAQIQTSARSPSTYSSGSVLYVNPNSQAARQANAWRSSRPADARAMDLLAAQPTAVWFGGWNADIYNDVRSLVQRAASAGKTPVLIAYNIPQRDCGGYSAGGVGSPEAYRTWISSIASAIGNDKAIVILEPDALSSITCLSGADQQTRMGLLSGAINTLKNNPNTAVYLDAGHSAWVDVNTMASRLQSANVARADGFVLNVSNFRTTSESTTYGAQLSQKLGDKHFVIDTARNGLGSNGEWCNPSGRAIGQKPTLQTGNALIDTYLWLKVPGESDGNCNGGPSAGQWWGDYALGLVQRSSYTY